MADAARPAVFTVPLEADLLTELAGDLIVRYRVDPLALADVLILLPSNRARTALTEAFVREAHGGMLLPRMVAVGDIELDETLATFVDPMQLAGQPAIAPDIGDWERRFLLTGLIRKQRPQLSAVEALRLATSLAQTIDQLDIEEIAPSAINAEHLEGELASHWNKAYRGFLELLAAHNRDVAARGMLGPSARRNLLLERLSDCLATQLSDRTVIAAGISTAAPAVAKMLMKVARMAKGQVILPFVDLLMEAEDWDALGPHQRTEQGFPRRNEETHPQYQLKLLLDRMGIQRGELSVFGRRKKSSGEVLNQSISAIFGSAKQSQHWGDLPSAIKKLPHVRALEADTVVEEALAIAILIRSAIETPGKRVALITADRELAVRTATQLKRWGMEVDDSAGVPLKQTMPATLLLALVDTLADKFGPVSLLALLKHPLVETGNDRLAWLEQVRKLDIALRGPRLGIGLDGISETIQKIIDGQKDEDKKQADRKLLIWWNGIADRLNAFETMPFANLNSILNNCAEIAGNLTGLSVWKGEAGRQLANLIEQIGQQDASAFHDLEAGSLPALCARLLDGEVVRPAYGRHPRISIWGLLEARMQHADMLICGGLNEGQWPQHTQPDPWLAPRLRSELGLQGLDRNIGLAAHDLASALGAQEVVLTRAKRDRSGPTIASRFWLRIEALLGKNLQTEVSALAWARAIDQREKIKPAPRPDIKPSAEQRSVDLSVTQVERLKADPFAFYAEKILKLRALRSPGTEPDHAWRGTAIHDLLEQWAKQDNCANGALLLRADALFSTPAINPVLKTLWEPRIRRALAWTEEEMQCQAEAGRVMLFAEEFGDVKLAGVRLSGKVDRIDRLADGSLAIVDYKTGKSPSGKKIAAGFAPQLGLLGLIAKRGGFTQGGGVASRFEYWTMSKDGGEFGAVKSAIPKKESGAEAAMTFIAAAEANALNVIEQWILGKEPFTAKLHPEHVVGDDYDQLMRLNEWYGRPEPDHG
jgi:ATP-dependent helicase/nuclease subunit B